MAIVAGLFALIFNRLLGKRKSAVVAIIRIAFYTILVGAGASMVRAALMAGSDWPHPLAGGGIAARCSGRLAEIAG